MPSAEPAEPIHPLLLAVEPRLWHVCPVSEVTGNEHIWPRMTLVQRITDGDPALVYRCDRCGTEVFVSVTPGGVS